ncbi:MAG TPA: hypothetical protein VN778_01390 [Verrucomicrobiae bacterium]|nr:hypothetical protein [Verrucomicrobiae bacterium]
MKIYLCASKSFFDKVNGIKAELEKLGHAVTPPNGFDEPAAESRHQSMTAQEYADWKTGMIRHDGEVVAAHDAVLVLNFEKNGQQNYIGGAAFLEMFKAWDLGKKVFLYNAIPDNMLKDEIIGLQPLVINRDLSLII